MRRFRLSTLMLLVVIAALCFALAMEHNRAKRLQVEIQAMRSSWLYMISTTDTASSPTTGRDWAKP